MRLSTLLSSPLARRILSGFGWSAIGSGVAHGILLVASVGSARILGPVRYGEVALVQTTITTLLLFSGPALGLAGTKHVAELRGRGAREAEIRRAVRTIWTLGVVISAVAAAALFVAAPWFSELVLGAPLVSQVRASTLLLLTAGINGIQLGILSGLERFKNAASVNIARSASQSMGLLVGAYVAGSTGAIVGLGLGTLCAVWAAELALREQNALPSEQHGESSDSIRHLRAITAIAVPAAISSGIVLAATWGAQLLLVRTRDGYFQVGLLSIANSWRTAILYLPTVLAQPAIPILSNLHGAESISSYRKVVQASLLASFISSALPSVAVVAAARMILGTYGEAYLPQWPVLALMAASAPFSAVAGALGTVLWSMGRMWHGLLVNVIWAGLFAAGVVWLIDMGALGVAAAYVVSYAVHAVIVGMVTSRLVRSTILQPSTST